MMPGFRGQLAMQGGPVPYLPIPAMTSNTTPAGWEAFASSQASATYAPWKAFDGDASGSSMWVSATLGMPQYVGLIAPSAFKAVKYALTITTVSVAPTTFELQASNDGLAWDVIDSRSGLSWTASERKQWDVTDPGAYTHHRMHVTTSGGGQTSTRFAELELLQEDDL